MNLYLLISFNYFLNHSIHLTQDSYYGWNLILNFINILVIGICITFVGYIIRITYQHQQNKQIINRNTYNVSRAVSYQLVNDYINQLSTSHLRQLKKRYKKKLSNNVYNKSQREINSYIIDNAMIPIYQSLIKICLFLNNYKINKQRFIHDSANTFIRIFKSHDNARKMYLKSHPNFKICYHHYRSIRKEINNEKK